MSAAAPQAAPALLQRAAALHQAGKPAEAEPIYLQILAAEPNHFDALHLLGVARYQLGRGDEALDLIQAALRQKPQAVGALTNCATVLLSVGRSQEALATCDKALAVTREDAEAHAARGNALSALKRFEEAIQSYDAAIALNPRHADACNNRGNILRDLGRLPEALQSYQQAVALRPAFAEALLNTGVTLNQMRRFAEAVPWLDRASAARANPESVLLNSGRALAALGQTDAAMAAFDRLFALRDVTIRDWAGDAGPGMPSVMLRFGAPARPLPRTAAAPALVVESTRLSALVSHEADWRDLAARAIEPNVFFEPGYILPVIDALQVDLPVLLVWDQATPRRLLGMLPGHYQHDHPRLPWPVLALWKPPQAAVGTPLIDAARAADVLHALFDYLEASAARPKILLFYYLNEAGPFAARLREVVTARGDRGVFYGRYDRALLSPGPDRDGYAAASFSGHRRKKLNWLRRQMESTGRVEYVMTTGSAAMREALASHLAIEAQGWKGRAGTAVITRPELTRMMENALVRLADEGKAAIASLVLDGRTIAATLLLMSGGAGWLWRTAYDEAFSRFSPGLFNLWHMTDVLLAETSLATVDSATIPDHPLIDRIWRQRITVGFAAIGIGAEAADRLEFTARIEGFAYRLPPYYTRGQ